MRWVERLCCLPLHFSCAAVLAHNKVSDMTSVTHPQKLWYICRPGQGIEGGAVHAQFCPRRLELGSILYWVSALFDEVCVVYAVDYQSTLEYKSPAPLWSIYWEQESPHSNISRKCVPLVDLLNTLLPAGRNSLLPTLDTLHLGCSYYLHSSHWFLSTWGAVMLGKKKRSLVECCGVSCCE